MRGVIAFVLALTSALPVHSEGPIFRHKDGKVDQEFEQVYQDLKNRSVTNWAAFTPTGAWTANVTYTGFYRRVGEMMEVQFRIICSGAPTAAAPTITIPNSLTIDTTKLLEADDATSPLDGHIMILDSGAARHVGRVMYGTSTAVKFSYLDDGAAAVNLLAITGNTVPITYAANDTINGFFRVPITGWSAR